MSEQRTGHDEVFDPGLQPERTLLAWRRTCLAFTITSLIGMRFTFPTFGIFAALTGVLGAGFGALAYVLAVSGYRSIHRSLHDAGGLTRSGLPMLIATTAVLAIGALCAMYLAYSR